MYTSLLYNSNVATSITSQGRALVSSMTLFFEGFLGNNVKFGSINETLEFVNNVCHEYSDRRFNDFEILDNPYVSIEDCFAKLVLNCEYRWIPNEQELELIWRTVSNLSNEDRNRVYYKNHLYAFMENSKLRELVIGMLKKLKVPMLNSVEVPEEIQDDLKYLSDLLKEYVYYRYMIIDRIDRCDNMIKAITMVSDTDSTIVSVDAWYRYIVNLVNWQELSIANYNIDPTLDDGKDINTLKEEKVLDYNFLTDEIIEVERTSRPDYLTPNDSVRHSIINIMGNVLDRLVNDYMEKFCENVHSWNKDSDRKCRIIAKNEFLFKRLLMGQVKKNYASIMELQEGNIVPEDKQLDVKGIPILAKSSTAETTRKALKKILLEDILKAPVIDQLKFVKDIAIFEKQIIESLYAGSKEYFKPVTIKAATSYEDPMRIQGVKASMVWNDIRPSDVEAIDLTTRNAINVVKVTINETTAESVKESDPEVYEHIMEALKKPEYKGNIDAIAFPFNMDTPKWLMPFINYDLIMEENVSGFPYESVGIKRLGRNYTGYSNIVEL